MLSIWTSIKGWMYGVIAAVVVAVAAWLYTKGRKDEQAKATLNRLEAIEDMRNVEKDVDGSSDQRLVDILTGRVR